MGPFVPGAAEVLDSLNLVTNCVDSPVTQKWYALRPQLIMDLRPKMVEC